MSNLQLRLATAAVALPLVGGVAWAGGWAFAVVLAAIVFLASTEFVHGWLVPALPIPAALNHAPVFAIAPLTIIAAHIDPWMVAGAGGFAVAFAAIGYSRSNLFGPRKPFRVYAWCLVYLGMAVSTLVLVRDAENGREWFLIGLLGTFATDTGAYAVGRAIGRHKLAPKISPGKTREGAVGGYVAGAAAVFALNAAFDTGYGAGTVWHLAIALPVAAIAGDLFESWMKRRMGVKDASGLLPGHGGFMDRLDSVIFVFPLVLAFLHLRVL